MLREIEELGFHYAELSHGLRVTMLPGILDYLKTGKVKISSVHNYCPQPVEVMGDSPDCLEFTHYDPMHRTRAVKMSCETIDCAVRVGAPVVVLHLGSMPHKDFERKLARRARDQTLLSNDGVRARIEALARREKVAAGYLARITSCLDPIVDHARKKGVRVGFECRSSALEFPMEHEFSALLERYPSDAAGYWHDFGHMQRKENISLGNHWQELSAKSSRLLGAHVHQTIFPDRDHQPLNARGGTVDYSVLSRAVPSGVPLVLELSPRTSAEAVQASAELAHTIFSFTPTTAIL